eukprot:1902332-Pleurochrysis_carterae.AAC.1
MPEQAREVGESGSGVRTEALYTVHGRLKNVMEAKSRRGSEKGIERGVRRKQNWGRGVGVGVSVRLPGAFLEESLDEKESRAAAGRD